MTNLYIVNAVSIKRFDEIGIDKIQHGCVDIALLDDYAYVSVVNVYLMFVNGI